MRGTLRSLALAAAAQFAGCASGFAAGGGDAACVPVEGAKAKPAREDCAVIQERLKVVPGTRRDLSPWGMPNAFQPLPDDGAMRARLRLDGRYGIDTPRLR